MPRKSPITTRGLLTAAVVLCIILWAAPSFSQSLGDPVLGKALFEDIPGVTNINTLATCTNCHNIQSNMSGDKSPRLLIGGTSTANISFDTAKARFVNAFQTKIAVMKQFNGQLTGDDVNNLAAYIADTPKVSTNTIDAETLIGLNGAVAFSAATSTTSTSHTVTITNSVATPATLQISAISLGTGTTKFTRGSGCVGTTLGAGQSCSFSVTFTPTTSNASPETRTLSMTMTQAGVASNRSLTLNGSVAGATTPPPATPPAANNSDEGGGAADIRWLAGLLAGTVALLGLRRRAARMSIRR